MANLKLMTFVAFVRHTTIALNPKKKIVSNKKGINSPGPSPNPKYVRAPGWVFWPEPDELGSG